MSEAAVTPNGPSERHPVRNPRGGGFTRFGPSVTFAGVLIVLGVVGIVALCVIAAACWGGACDPRQPLRLEMAKSGLQVIVVIVIGGLVTFLTGSFKNALDSARADREMAAEVYRRLVQCYRSVKLLRRRLRVQLNEASSAAVPREMMLELESTQLDLEQLIWELPTLSRIFDVDERAEITPMLRKMEGYVRTVLKEWEDAPTRSFSDLDAVVKFVGPSKAPLGFHAEFVVPYTQVRNGMRRSLQALGLV